MRRADVLIVGQGLAGTVLAWELERAAISFVVADAGSAIAASRAAAGLVNPVTGRRLVKSWRVDSVLPLAREVYRSVEAETGVALWREVRIRRLFADDRECATWKTKVASGELAPYAGDSDEVGGWIQGAARVEVQALLSVAAARLRHKGWLREEAVDVPAELANYGVVIDCRGATSCADAAWRFVPWEFSKGETLEIATTGLDPAIVLNRRQWVVATSETHGWVGATHEPGVHDHRATETARSQLASTARELLHRPFDVVAHHAGVRVTLRDKRPVVGRHPDEARLGIINGLAAKGVLWAPLLARAWVSHLVTGAPFERESDVARFTHADAGGVSHR
jgi:glycine/D-amino acid oxidase-like deaminating enzyme